MARSVTLEMTAGHDDSRGIVHMSVHDMRVAPGPVESGILAADRMTARNCGLPTGGQVSLTPSRLGYLDQLLLRLDTKVATTPGELQDALFDMALGEGDCLGIVLPKGGRAQLTVMATGATGPGLVGEETQIAIETPADAIAGFERIGGMARQVAAVHEMIAAPLLRPELFQRLGIPAPRGVLFTGPPGSGKTLLARTVAQQTRASFFQIDGPEILSKHYGDSEAALRQVFEAASKAQPAIIFIDEIDSLAPRRDGMSSEKQVERRIVAQLLTLMDGLSDRGRIIVMAASNLPNSIDPALRRPGRFDREIVFLPPTDAERRDILVVHLSDAPLAADVDLDKIASAARGYVGADLAALARETAMAALARTVRTAGSEALVRVSDLEITQADLETGLCEAAPSLLRGAGGLAAPLR